MASMKLVNGDIKECASSMNFQHLFTPYLTGQLRHGTDGNVTTLSLVHHLEIFGRFMFVKGTLSPFFRGGSVA